MGGLPVCTSCCVIALRIFLVVSIAFWKQLDGAMQDGSVDLQGTDSRCWRRWEDPHTAHAHRPASTYSAC
jgi:hypothetical protein